MNDELTLEILQEYIDRIEEYCPRNDSWLATPALWTWELNHNPQHFRRNDDGKLIWLGYKVVNYETLSGAEKKFWRLADKIIPKEY